MHVFAMLKWTATILLVSISECRGRSVDQVNTSCVYSFHVPGSQVQAGCPGNGQSSEVLRLAESLEKLKCAFEVLQVILRAYQYQNRVIVWFLCYINIHIIYDSLFTSHHIVNISPFQFWKNQKYHHPDFIFGIDAI